MLILSRNLHGWTYLYPPDGRGGRHRIGVCLLETCRGKARLGFEAGKDVPIFRDEITPEKYMQRTQLPPGLEKARNDARNALDVRAAHARAAEEGRLERLRRDLHAVLLADLPASLLAAADVESTLGGLTAGAQEAWVSVEFDRHWPILARYRTLAHEPGWIRDVVQGTPVGAPGQPPLWCVQRHGDDLARSAALVTHDLGTALALAQMTPDEVEAHSVSW